MTSENAVNTCDIRLAQLPKATAAATAHWPWKVPSQPLGHQGLFFALLLRLLDEQDVEQPQGRRHLGASCAVGGIAHQPRLYGA